MQIRIDAVASLLPCTSSLPAASTDARHADPTHLAVFHQVEALAVDEGITFADLKRTLEAMAERPVRRGARKHPVHAVVFPVRRTGRPDRRHLFPL